MDAPVTNRVAEGGQPARANGKRQALAYVRDDLHVQPVSPLPLLAGSARRRGGHLEYFLPAQEHERRSFRGVPRGTGREVPADRLPRGRRSAGPLRGERHGPQSRAEVAPAGGGNRSERAVLRAYGPQTWRLVRRAA